MIQSATDVYNFGGYHHVKVQHGELERSVFDCSKWLHTGRRVSSR